MIADHAGSTRVFQDSILDKMADDNSSTHLWLEKPACMSHISHPKIIFAVNGSVLLNFCNKTIVHVHPDRIIASYIAKLSR